MEEIGDLLEGLRAPLLCTKVKIQKGVGEFIHLGFIWKATSNCSH